LFATLVDRLSLPVFLLERRQVTYSNRAASLLVERFRERYDVEVTLLLVDHITTLEATSGGSSALTLITTPAGEPFYMHLIPLQGSRGIVAAVIRHPGIEIEAFRRRYRLSSREAQVAELVLNGYSNREIAESLGITSATAKKHLTHVFDKLGVDSRAQLLSRLA
jgi:DNA-binding CsgD family transcriptional regulator